MRYDMNGICAAAVMTAHQTQNAEEHCGPLPDQYVQQLQKCFSGPIELTSMSTFCF